MAKLTPFPVNNRNGTFYPSNYGVSDGLIGYWGFDLDCLDFASAATIQARDLSPFSRTASFGSGLTVAAGSVIPNGKIGGAVRLPGASTATTYITLPASVSVKGSLAASVSVWYNPLGNTAGNGAIYFESTASSGFTRIAIFHAADASLLAVCRDTDTGSSFAITIAGAFTNQVANNYRHLVLTYDSVSDRMCVYINAVLSGSNTAAKGAFTSGAPGDPIAIGGYTQPLQEKMANGNIDDVRLYNRALHTSEIAELYKLGLQGRRSFSTIDAAFPSISPAFLAAWARQANLPVLGAGTY